MSNKLVVASVLAVLGAPVFAAGVDLSSLTAGVDVSTVIPAILAVAVILLGPQIAKYAIGAVRGMFPKA